MKYQIRAFKENVVDAVETVHVGQDDVLKAIENMGHKHKLGTSFRTTEPGVHIFDHGTVHVHLLPRRNT